MNDSHTSPEVEARLEFETMLVDLSSRFINLPSEEVDRDKCIGCGVCVLSCRDDAIVMEPVSEEEWFHVPSSMAEWEERRLEYLAASK